MKRSPIRRKTPIGRKTKVRLPASVKRDQAAFAKAAKEWRAINDAPTRARRAVPKRKALRSRAYLDFVKQRPCCVCGAPGPSDPHHIGPPGTKGTAYKTDDFHTVPLCRTHHDEWHQHGEFPSAAIWLRRPDFNAAKVALLIEWLRESEAA